MPIFHRLRPEVAAVRFAVLALSSLSVTSVLAQQVAPGAAENTLPAVEVTSSQDYGFVAQKAVSSTKSDKPLFETPQSISVLTREYLDSRQVTSLNEAIQSTAGVSSGGFGRRGWDDFSIRGQRASESIYVDGLKLGQSNWIAQEVYGVESIEIVKGPASINFGQMQPGGIVNMVSKRPRSDAFNQVGFTVGSYGYRQGTFDFGRPLQSENGKAAFRINGMASDADDPTDYVWSKNRYIAPSLSLDLGPRTDFTILAAINERQYIRQQGLPVLGSILAAPGRAVRNSLFTSDPSVGPYDASQRTLGYALTHRFDSGWTLRQNFRFLDMDLKGALVSLNGPLQANGNVVRNVLLQDISERSAALDTNIERTFAFGGAQHAVMFGLDLNQDKLNEYSQRCAIDPLNVYSPMYGKAIRSCATTTRAQTDLSYTALYVRDQIKFNDKLSLNMALRHDRATTETLQLASGSRKKEDSEATTGNVGLMYQVTRNIAPYISYATSFLPVAGTDAFQNQFKPEEGKQTELGLKFQSDDKRLNASFAYYDLTRKNVTTSDVNNPGFSTQVGEQSSKGYEAELVADLRNGWTLSAAASVVDAKITQDTNLSNIGKRVQNVPERSGNLWANYRFGGALSAWGYGVGLRHESSKTSPAVTYQVPGYTVADASVSYQGKGYRLMLNVKNIFDKDYYAGVLSANAVPVGDPRTVMLKTVFDF